MPRPALVIREVDQLARRAKWRVLHFLEHELPLAHAGRLDAAPPRAQATLDDLADMPDMAQRAVRTFVAQFLRRSLTTGRGLGVIGDAAMLRRIAAYVRTALDVQGVGVIAIAGNAAMSASLRDAAAAAPLLIVERADFAGDDVRALLATRAAVRKPVMVTACAAPDPPIPGDLSLLVIPSPNVHAAA